MSELKETLENVSVTQERIIILFCINSLFIDSQSIVEIYFSVLGNRDLEILANFAPYNDKISNLLTFLSTLIASC